MNIIAIIAKELGIAEKQVQQAVDLLDEGKTVPFIARYRKEATGSLDDQQLRTLSERLSALRNLEKRGEEIRNALETMGVLTDEIVQKITEAKTLAELEDIYRPYRPKRRTRAMIARERGLEPLAMLILLQQKGKDDPESAAQAYIDPEKGVESVEDALAGARDILAEQFANDAELRGKLRQYIHRSGVIRTKAAKEEDSVYSQYYDFSQQVSAIPAHRVLAVNRGEREEFLKVAVEVDDGAAVNIICRAFIHSAGKCTHQLEEACADAWNRLIQPSLEREIRNELTDMASDAGIREFSRNLRQLLMQPPVKGKVTLGVDPGYRTGCKLAVIDETGRVLDTGVGYFTLAIHEKQKEQAKKLITGMIRKHGVTAIAIGNGTASRESEAFIADIIRDMPSGIAYAIVNEAGASVYSASKLGAEEFPDFDVTLRSAVAIARRLQDPLAELVKVDPKSIGVGQYQHDLKEASLTEALDGVVEDCVSKVGVELSTASATLLSHVAGIGPQLAKNIVAHRDEFGFNARSDLKKVKKLGPKAFEQCAGFLRLRDSKQILDATAVHPESYAAATKLISLLGYHMEDMRGGAPADFAERAEKYGVQQLAEACGTGLPTMKDIISELQRPGRDPREDLPPVLLRSDVIGMEDLVPGMELMGTVRNVIDFGAFVDIGVHQDGLVHISRMARRFIRHPSEVVKIGDAVKVWVQDVDLKKKRISLTMLEPGK
ncbi:MAG: RNA-binding transcriptional accessory protein [Clostridia bacterium]|nr:RNA-binding transcriptional accessory protein [Clostridia bacterium]